MDVRTDIYAIGALLHYMFTGKSPDMQAIVTPGKRTGRFKKRRYGKFRVGRETESHYRAVSAPAQRGTL